MKNILIKNDKDLILEKIKVDKTNVSFILDLAKLGAKRGRKAYEDMSEDELYESYVKKCERQGHYPLKRELWDEFQIAYDYEDLLSTEDIESADIRYQPEAKSVKLGYIGDELDIETLDTLYKILFKALRKRLIMILNLENIPNLINTAITYRNQGYDCKGINALMNSKLEETRKLLENADIKEWLNIGATDMIFEANDYIETYQRVLRQISDIRDESLDYFKDIIHNDYDIFEEEILINEFINISNFSDNIDSEDE